MTQLLIDAMIFFAVWLGIIGVWLLSNQKRLAGRLAGGSVTMTAPDVYTSTGRQHHAGLEAALGRHRWSEALHHELWRAGVRLSVAEFSGLVLLAVVLLGAFGLFVARSPLMAVVGAAMGVMAPLVVLRRLQARRLARFVEQLPDALVLISSSLRTGYSFLQSLQLVADEMPAPMSQEMRRVLEEVSVGATLDESLTRLHQRVPTYDVDLLVTAIGIQYQVGGNLAELMDTLQESIRDRFKTKGEIDALTAEGRLSGIVLFCLPLALLVVLALMNPTYMSPLFLYPLGRVLLVGAFLLQVLGGYIMHRMMRIDL